VEQDTWGSAAAAAADPYQQQQMQQMQFTYVQQQQLGMPPDPARLAALAVREQQLAALQGVRMELESVRLLADQVNRREKLKKQVGFTPVMEKSSRMHLAMVREWGVQLR
jgi:hypothetical protein